MGLFLEDLLGSSLDEAGHGVSGVFRRGVECWRRSMEMNMVSVWTGDFSDICCFAAKDRHTADSNPTLGRMSRLAWRQNGYIASDAFRVEVKLNSRIFRLYKVFKAQLIVTTTTHWP